jgi:hypothetical protein
MNINNLTPAPWYAHNPDDGCCMNVLCVTNSPVEPDTESGDTTGIIAGTLIQTPMTLGQWHTRWEADAEFIALARNALDVQMRRGWSAQTFKSGYRDEWVIELENGSWLYTNDGKRLTWPDPFTALVQADAWYTDNEGC